MYYNNTLVKKSYGIACCRYNQKSRHLEILMVHKRVTFSLIEFALGRYRRGDDSRLLYLFEHMTHDEKLDVSSLDYSRIWYRIWLVNPESKYNIEYLRSSPERYEKYLKCKDYYQCNFLIDNGSRLKQLLSSSNATESLWELPKGRPANANEKPLNCAIREFTEETGLPLKDIEFISNEPYICNIQNGKIRYQSYYYLALIHSDSEFNKNNKLRLDYSNISQIAEITDIRWMDLEKVRIVDTTNKLWLIIKNMFSIIKKKYKLKKLTELNII